MKKFIMYLFVSLIAVVMQNHIVAYETITLPPNEARIITVPAQGMVLLRAENISYQTAYIVCQAHAHTRNITLSMSPVISLNASVVGRDVGVLSVMNVSQQWMWYLFSNLSTNHSVLVHTTYIMAQEPMPGGCNQEFDLKNDPNIHLSVGPTKATVYFQWSNTGHTPSGTLPLCSDTTYQSYLEYHSYVRYIPAGDFGEEAYFENLRKMLLASDVKENGIKLKGLSNKPYTQSEYTISSYAKQGVVYTVMVKEHNLITGVTAYGAYIPVVDYGCDIEKDDACTHKDIAAMILVTVGGILGIFLAFLGHRFFKTENFLFGFIIFALVFYQVFALLTDINFGGVLSLAGMFGLIGGCLLLGLWWYVGFPILNVLFIGLVAGYLLSCILFYTTFANLSPWESPFNYGITFACVTLLIPAFILWFTRILNILSCALIGSYGVIIAIDTYIGSGMRYPVLNALRHGADRSYVKVTVTGPFTKYEWILTVLWVLLATCAFIFQTFRERKKAPFPPCPRQRRNRERDLRTFIRPTSPDREPLLSRDTTGPTMGDNSRQPLLRGDNTRQYGTHNATVTENSGSEVEVNRPR